MGMQGAGASAVMRIDRIHHQSFSRVKKEKRRGREDRAAGTAMRPAALTASQRIN
jgi:RIO-like serine/threonine protein kinase